MLDAWTAVVVWWTAAVTGSIDVCEDLVVSWLLSSSGFPVGFLADVVLSSTLIRTARVYV